MPSNPYYIPRKDTTGDFMNMAQLGLQLYGLKQQSNIAQMTAKEQAARTAFEQKKWEGYTTPGITDFGHEIAAPRRIPGERDIKLGELANQTRHLNIEEAKLPAGNQPFNKAWVNKLEVSAMLNNIPVKELRVFGLLNNWAVNEDINRRQASDLTYQNWDNIQKMTDEDVTNITNKLANKAAKLELNDPERVKLMKQIDNVLAYHEDFSLIKKEDVKKTLYNDIYQEELNSKTGTQMPTINQVLAEKVKLGIPLTDEEKGLLYPPTTPTLQRKTKTWSDEKGRKFSQDFIFDTKSGKEESIDKPYLVEVPKAEAPPKETATNKRMLKKDVAKMTTDIFNDPSNKALVGEVDFVNKNRENDGKKIVWNKKRGEWDEQYIKEDSNKVSQPKTPQEARKVGWIIRKAKDGKSYYIDPTGSSNYGIRIN